MGYVWYADVYFLVNFLMNTSALFFAALLCNCRVSVRRIVLASAGAAASRIFLLILLPEWFGQILLVHMVVHPLTVCFAFLPGGWREFFRLMLSVCLLLLVAGGIQESLWIQAGVTSETVILFVGVLAMAMFVLWQLRQRRLCRLCVAELWLGGERICVKAYCDSGNLLRHPENGKPVSIVDRAAIPPLWLHTVGESERICCRTVSDSAFCLEVITVDRMDVYLKGTAREIRAPLLGLHSGALMGNGDIQMLLNAAVC
ncbi:MAG: sigma-E processing peptidase SpoIIGA [Clostridiales bacterium]|nr:sigma-E processing peptidase SpoIIGA [Clostridiales bacterium]